MTPATKLAGQQVAVPRRQLPARPDPGFEIDLLVEKGREEGPYSSRELAHAIVTRLRRDDPQLLTDWLEAQAENLLWAEINRQDRSDRSRTRARASRSVFAAAEAALDATTARKVLTSWLTTRYVNSEGLRMQLGTMRKVDLTYVAGTYRSRAESNLLQAAFMDALARKVGRGTVADHFDETKLSQLWASCIS